MGLGDGLGSRPGAAGAVASGVLAAVVASPCTAPFMGAALGYALTRPPLEALAVFLALGAGFALPVLSLSVWPAWTRWLPRPGPWTGRLQQVLAFPMYAAAAWLVWVVSQQATPRGLAAVLAGLVAVGLAAWLVGQRQAGWRGSAVAATVSGLIALALVPLAGDARLEAPASATAWTPERVEALRREGRPVLVNFTAAWCITCQVNERVALATEAVVEARERKQVAYLKGDWTRRDARISRELERHGRSGVPLYLLYPAGPGAPRVLPPVLTEGTVLDALDAL
jgi:thiol:disulfide interchange protein DsbD